MCASESTTTCQPLLSICRNGFLKIQAIAVGQKPSPLIKISEQQQRSPALRSSPTNPILRDNCSMSLSAYCQSTIFPQCFPTCSGGTKKTTNKSESIAGAGCFPAGSESSRAEARISSSTCFWQLEHQNRSPCLILFKSFQWGK